jgi:hypothetical protein
VSPSAAWRIAAAIVLLAAACIDATAPNPSIVSHSVTNAGPLLQRVEVMLDEPGTVRVAWGDGDARLEVESSVPGLEHSLLLTRLRPALSYEYEVRAGADRAAGAFVTDTLPSDLAALGLEATGTPTQPLTLLEFARIDDSPVFSGVAIVDHTGQVVWYFRAERSITGTTRRSNGNFVFLDSNRGLIEVTPGGQVVSTLPQDDDRVLHHDVIAGPGNVLWALRLDRRTVNDTLVAGEAIWEWDPEAGTEVKRWSSFDALDPVTDRGPRYSPGDWLHANSLFLGPRGNVLVSLHHLNQVLSIAPDFGSLEWRLGGTNATLSLPAGDRFSGQHTAAEIATDRILLFDNGFERSEPWSRALELDLSGGTVRNVWQFRPPRDNWSRAVSAARRLSNGNTMVAFGMSPGLGGSTGPIEVYEAAPAGAVVWHLEVRGEARIMFRATPLATIGGERAPGAQSP